MKKKEKQGLHLKKIDEIKKLIEKKRAEIAKITLTLTETKDKNLPKKLKKEMAILQTILGEKKYKEEVQKEAK